MFQQSLSVLRDDNHRESHIGVTEKGQSQDQFLTPLQPHTILLKDGETISTMYPIPANAELLPVGLLAFLLDEFNMEIEKGDSFPYYETLTLDQFKDVWFHKDGHICVMVLGEIPELDYSILNDLSNLENNYGTDIETMRHTSQYKKRKERRNLNLNIQWEKQCLGLFSLQPAYPGRSSHVVTGSFLVNAGIRGKRIGRTLVETFIEWSQRLGFTSCYFPLIYGTNVGIRRILEGLNFRQIGKLPESGILKGFDVPVDSFMYGKEFTHITRSMDLLRDPNKSEEIARYERLKYYMGTGKYPANCDRNEKARLRVTAKSHSLVDGKLLIKGKEIITDPNKQREISLEMHLVDHQGINKLTSKIAERYHWKGIKQTVTEIISECRKCKMRHQDGVGVVVVGNKAAQQAHMIPNNNMNMDEIDHSAQLSRMAAVVVNSLQEDENSTRNVNMNGNENENSTPADLNTNQIASRAIPKMSHDSLVQPMLSSHQTMNAFDHFMEEEHTRKKRKYLEVSTDTGTPSSSTPGTVPVMDRPDQSLEDVMLNLQDDNDIDPIIHQKGSTSSPPRHHISSNEDNINGDENYQDHRKHAYY
ncbi:hypothetical protein HG535_0H00590 [Zygotorulaspora mrakii]|uniref:N-acetyltransferase domain-containing protein n=1 Tax=Zygotorulaspora mrakii TaxID=42260 RepID=A0A7H9B911_ZYGMR|nr:uncharacterized protein HG535_0H00590 [Zygotorulaspora mrakii]QLG74734.1 hypothetical protein HG535_0H00590 [Zygotorulaspora mrakii]